MEFQGNERAAQDWRKQAEKREEKVKSIIKELRKNRFENNWKLYLTKTKEISIIESFKILTGCSWCSRFMQHQKQLTQKVKKM